MTWQFFCGRKWNHTKEPSRMGYNGMLGNGRQEMNAKKRRNKAEYKGKERIWRKCKRLEKPGKLFLKQLAKGGGKV